ncbi:MAG: 50S ribosomal protein L24 [Cytophagales bacterium]|nr:50S ribosomal protein L24 [Cytophagales bacterium]
MKTPRKIHIQRGDIVRVISGNSKGKEAKVLRVIPSRYQAVLEGVQQQTKYIKSSKQDPNGRIDKKEAGIHISNLALIDKETAKTTRVGRRWDEEKKKRQRYAKRSGKPIPDVYTQT